MQTGDTGLNLIKAYEGFSASPRLDERRGAGNYIVGYGHISDSPAPQVSQREATNLLLKDVSPIETLLRDTVRTPLNQNEHDALVSFVFNIGADNFKRSTVLKRLNEGDKLGAAEAFERWTKARVDGKLMKLDGLVRRRAAEKSLFLMPTDAELVIPTSEVAPADECDGQVLAPSEVTHAPLVDFDSYRRDKGRSLTPEEIEGRMSALYAASHALMGDPSKMIIAKAEEREDIGVTVGAVMLVLLAVAFTLFSGVLALDAYAPDALQAVGLSPSLLQPVLVDLPLWMLSIGLGLTYFSVYIVAKRAARHSIKKARAKEVARVRGN
ncbi:lysozyme [Parvularcula sp. ZS-1/3]|uniref:Lysozyme n=1 Tax=Parvularcula mediterranea TaxID=2732508 RepID=A0A7Y3RN74_9PROT|nr:lysozyme [Parvularcula mediterranea]NNU17161.1 lysozyme [Parvularcula mediterranea]